MAARTTVNLTDPVSTWVTKTNTISTDVGDRTQFDAQIVAGNADSNLVAAINFSINNAGTDSAAVIILTRSSVSVTDNGGDGSLSYNSGTGVISYTGPSPSDVRAHFQKDSANGIGFDSSTGRFSIAPNTVTGSMIATNTITSANFNSAATLTIKDVNGTTVKTMFSPGS